MDILKNVQTAIFDCKKTEGIKIIIHSIFWAGQDLGPGGKFPHIARICTCYNLLHGACAYRASVLPLTLLMLVFVLLQGKNIQPLQFCI